TLPYTVYTLSGSASQTNNNGIFTGLGEGTYNVIAGDSNGQTYSQTGIVLSAPNQLQLSAPATICPGQSTALTATGGTGAYTWTANPPDASITNPNNATQNVSPSVTTTYTVNSGSVSSPTNLIQNGDFSQGNTLFVTEYTEVANPNPFGVQASYEIVTNPAAWFSPFCNSGDHTTGSGNLMVFDGSVDPTGNVIAWSNQNPISVLPNTNYTFSYYVESVAPDNPARLEVLINGVSQGAPVTAPGTTCLWTQVSYDFNSGANTSLNFAIYDRNPASGGNDFALDDISLKETVTCQYQKSVTVTVTPGTTPTFTAVSPICPGGSLSALPTTSNNGVTGTWSPALNNTATTTYTFTPTAGQCASPVTLTITVNSSVTPTFAGVEPICSGSALAPLPTTSTNGITGSWSPALNNTATTTYTFTPTAGQCAAIATLTITVNQPVTPTFTAVAAICSGSPLSALPTTSNNGITGTWSPALDNSATTTYTFTPTAGQCASAATLAITVNDSPQFSIAQGCNGVNYTLTATLDNASNPTYSWLNPTGAEIGTASSVVITTPGTYQLVVTQNGCSATEPVNVLSATCGGQIQKGISPNNDGWNDFFDLEAYNVTELKIYNRYGMKVYSKAHYENQWYGQTDSGDELPDGTYYYVIDFADSATKTGWIYSNRAQ
ncbi:MAG: gliding motility-associated C-terminal domain-containing protein, partial [Flavobacterium sp.]